MSQSLSSVPNILKKYKFDFSRLPERLKCILCHGILKNAKQTSCGCKVCDNCINSYLSSGQKACPSNQPDCADVILNINENIYQDNAINKEIGNIVVKCPFFLCILSCALKYMVEHIDSCEFRVIICEQCGIKLSALTTVHTDLMRKSKGLDDIKLIEHLKICPNKNFKCLFHQFDCKIYKMTKENLMNHLKESYLPYISSLVNKIKDLETRTFDLELLINNNILLMKELLEMNKNSSESDLKLEKNLEESIKKVPDLIINQTVDNNGNEIFRNASFIWKFTDFEVRRVDAESGGCVSITSDAFYTSEFGYKMCVRVYPAGAGVGKGTHLSVFFAIMKGEFDDSLSWPFGYKVTVSILDQESGSKHHSDTFQPDASSACYQKPTDEFNIAFGFPRFILLSSIMNNNSSIYCKNDTIFLEIEVDTMGISRFES